MAIMIPQDVDCFNTEGEKQTYFFLQAVAKPDNQYLCWYLPHIRQKEPDFVLFSKKLGLIILEVKDWNIGQIKEANPEVFHILQDNQIQARQNPLKQARQYFIAIMDTIKKDGKLVSNDPFYHGNPEIPINYGVIFSNINKHEYTQKGFHRVISEDKIFFWDDLHPSSPVCCDSSGACFSHVLEKMFPPKFSFTVTGKNLEHLKQLIFPIVKIELPERKTEFTFIKRANRLRSLDNHQDAIARMFDGGHRIITGPSGSGKTLILVHKAALLMKYNPDIKNILFVCFYITLVNYIKRPLANKEVPLGKNGVQVFHFYQLCSEIIGEKIAYEHESSEYYELVDQEVLAKVQEYNTKYDAIFVDKGI